MNATRRSRTGVAGACVAALLVCGRPCVAEPHLAWVRSAELGSGPSSPAPAAADAELTLAAVNAQRAAFRLPPLTLDSRLTQAALAHARDLVRMGRLDHRGSDGSNVGHRASRAGYRWSTVAENLARARTSSPRTVVRMWMNSPGHRANLLNRRCTQAGVAHVRDMWVLVLARPS